MSLSNMSGYLCLITVGALSCATQPPRPSWLAPDRFEATRGSHSAGVAPLWASERGVQEAYRVSFRPAFAKPTNVWIEVGATGVKVRADVPDPTYSFAPRLRTGVRVRSDEDFQRIQFYLDGSDFWHQGLSRAEPGCDWGLDRETWQFEGYRAPQEYVVFNSSCPDVYLSGLAAYLALLGPESS